MNQHRAVNPLPVTALADDRRPPPGPIAILPQSTEFFADAVRLGGGTVGDLSDDTRGILWLSVRRADQLGEVLSKHPGIGWVQLPNAGVDAFSAVLARHAGTKRLVWTSAKGAYAQPVAEHALALTLALLRLFPKRILATSWSTEKGGTSLYGLEVLIVGAGGVALELIRLLEPFGVRVTVVRRSLEPVSGADRTVTAEHLLDVIPDADVVVLAAAFTDSTRYLIGETELRAMKDTAILVNIARGGLVDTDALAGALASRIIAGAGIDVTDPEPLPDGHPLWNERNIIITPHTADTPEMIEPLLAERVRANVVAFLADGRFEGVVDPAAGY
jgi:phosphoglycerate dehydrogenase-like enzyme